MNYLKNCPNCSTTLRFPASQGTVLVRCPVCSHRFQFDAALDLDFQKEGQQPKTFQFQPSKQEYLNLFWDLLYAPVDYFKTKFAKLESKPKDSTNSWKKPKLFIEILLFLILLLYVIRSIKLEPTQSAPKEEKTEENLKALPEGSAPVHPPLNQEPTLDI